MALRKVLFVLVPCVVWSLRTMGGEQVNNPSDSSVEVRVSDWPDIPVDPACAASTGKKPPSCERSWALRHVGATSAHQRLRAESQGAMPGHGVVVAQIDTGLAKPAPQRLFHPALRAEAVLTHDAAGKPLPLVFYGDCDARANCGPRDPRAEKDPTDRLVRTKLPFATQPGHGTGTSSILISRGELSPEGRCGGVCGIAPGVELVPHLVTGGVMLSQGRSMQVAKAIIAAGTESRLPPLPEDPTQSPRRIDVLTMSMGIRAPDPEMEEAVRLAERNGVIVVSAAGQGPLTSSNVRFPAQFPSAIAVSGTNVEATPWRLGHPWSYPPSAGKGAEVAISAPAVDVWRATWDSRGGAEVATIGRGRGTSFATPLVAGAAALWIQHFGRAGLDARYGRSAVPAAFRYWLTQHGYRTPAEMCDLLRESPSGPGVCANKDYRWDLTKRWGKGVLAVDRLLGPQELDGPENAVRRLAVLPSAREVCEDVYRRRGPADWDTVCPVGSPGRDESVLAERPPKPDQEKRTYTSAVALVGRPFGHGPAWHPAFSYGVIFGDHHLREPKGLLIQGTAAVRSFKGMIGFAQGFEYSPFGHSRRFEIGMIPGFGPTVGYAVKAGYLRKLGANYLGGQVEIVLYRYRFEIGPFWRVGSATNPDATSHCWAWSFGFGF